MAGEVGFALDDRRQAIELASLVCKSPEAGDRFLSFCERQASDLHALIMMSMQIILRMRRTMAGSELDVVIASLLADQALAREHLRRKEWQRALERAAAFEREHVIMRTRQLPVLSSLLAE